MQNLVPIVVESSPKGERSWDIFSRLLEDRIIMLNGPVADGTAGLIVSQLLFLNNKSDVEPINMWINSPGGLVTEGLAIYDAMNFVKAPVATYVMGHACSMGSLLASSGEKGQRYMLPSSRHMAHQVSSGTQGTVLDQDIALAESKRLNDYLHEIYVKNTGHAFEKLKEDLSRDKYMNAEESVAYGLADMIVQ